MAKNLLTRLRERGPDTTARSWRRSDPLIQTPHHTRQVHHLGESDDPEQPVTDEPAPRHRSRR